MTEKKVIDRLERPLRDLRISVTDKCNFRCTYCMPRDVFDHNYKFLEKSKLLSFEEMIRLVKIFAGFGVKKIRITGGEPLMRKGLPELVRQIAAVEGIEDVALTTNGVLLPIHAEALAEAGLKRVTVSLDSLKDEEFGAINGRGTGIGPVIRGMEAAEEAGLEVKVNMMVRKNMNESQVLPMLEFFAGTGRILRFIEYMDVGNSNGWNREEVFTKQDILDTISGKYTVEPLKQRYFGEVATRFQIKESGQEFGVISSISDVFCSSCTRARLSADGAIYTCLFSSKGTSLRNPLRNGADDMEMAGLIKNIWEGRHDRYSEERANTASVKRKKIEMSYIGG